MALDGTDEVYEFSPEEEAAPAATVRRTHIAQASEAQNIDASALEPAQAFTMFMGKRFDRAVTSAAELQAQSRAALFGPSFEVATTKRAVPGEAGAGANGAEEGPLSRLRRLQGETHEVSYLTKIFLGLVYR